MTRRIPTACDDRRMRSPEPIDLDTIRIPRPLVVTDGRG